jgi:nucleoid-associated protein YgaU
MLAPGKSDVAARAEVNFVLDVPAQSVEPQVATAVPAPETVVGVEPGQPPEAGASATAAPVEPPASVTAVPVDPAREPAMPPSEPAAVVAATPEVAPRSVTTPATPSVIDVGPPPNPKTGPDLIAEQTQAPTLPGPTHAPLQLSETQEIPTMLAVPTGDAGSEAQRFAAGKVIIRRGDNLWAIARRTYGDGLKYTMIFDANDDQIRNPNQIYPGQVFALPTEGTE